MNEGRSTSFLFNLKFTNFKKLFNSQDLSFFKLGDVFSLFFFVGTWIKLRVLYYVNNWVYSTNHKRIAVNYFWFVILAGIVGMVLATIIRLELAYPGVGIFAGDSLQYLSMVTAHGVIMVFFMIMPLLAGAFGNFLLPTQLGVHDVAFPRLNSAAFWFLPAGLIMLANLVCVDRRYQRMNCFNIREVQSLLKKRFFVDLVNPHEFTDLLDSSMIGIKYKLNDINYTNPHALLNYKWGLKTNNNSRFFNYNFHKNDENTTLPFYLLSRLDKWTQNPSIFKEYLYKFLYKITEFKLWRPISYFFDYIWNFSFSSLLSTKTPSVWIYSTLTYYSYSDTTRLVNSISSFFSNLYVYFFSSFFFKIKNKFNIYGEKLTNVFKLFTIENFYNWYETQKKSTLFYFFNLKNNIILELFSNFATYLTNNFIVFFKNLWIYLKSIKFWDFKLINIPSQNDVDRLHNAFFDKFMIDGKEYTVQEIINSNKQFSVFQLIFLQANAIRILPSKIKPVNFNSPTIDNSKFDYSSVSTNFHVAFNFLLSFPYYVLNICKNIYSTEEVSKVLSNFFYYITHWVLATFFDINFIFSTIYFCTSEKYYIPVYTYFNNIFLVLKWFVVGLARFIFFDVKDSLMILINGLSWIIIPVYNFFFTDFFFYFEIFLHYSIKSFDFNFKINNSFNTYYDNFLFYKGKKTNFFDIKTENVKIHEFNNEKNQLNRFIRFSDPVFKYDYKAGDYFPKLYKEVYKQLFVSLINITNGLKTAPWFRFVTLDETLDFLNINIRLKKGQKNSYSFINDKINTNFIYYSFWFIQPSELNTRWISNLALNQKFYNMFLTSSLQQRIYNNWRQLKFTREAWRCKMLAARHQKTLFKRYVHEDGVFWSIERNAKDLLPGWAMITPFSSRTRFTAIGKVDIGLMGVLLVLNSSIVSGANFLVTYRYLSTLNNRKMRDARSFFAEGVMVTSWMMILANPMLVIGIIMLLSDRHWQTSFFDYSGGGDTVLFQHMFWFFGHPEVYIIMIPVFGFVNTILSYYLRKRVSARASLIYSMYTIAFLGFFVWGHHMYMVGLAHTTRMLFSTLTVMISVPAATKLMHWCVTIANSTFVMELPFLFVLTFIFFFVSGGISGMYVAHTGMDILFHDTFYVIGHFHVMFAGAAMFGSFGAFYFYFPAIFGVKYSRIYAYLHYTYYLIGQLMTVVPMFWLGYAGMPRRVLDYPASLGGWHSIISAGHMLSVAGLMAFFIMIFDSLRQGKAVIRNTYGINRFNTCLNFYLYESSRLLHVQRRNLFLFKSAEIINLKLNNVNYTNYEYLESTLLSYTIFKKKVKKNV